MMFFPTHSVKKENRQSAQTFSGTFFTRERQRSRIFVSQIAQGVPVSGSCSEISNGSNIFSALKIFLTGFFFQYLERI